MMMSLSKWTGNDTDRLEDAKTKMEVEIDKKLNCQQSTLEDGIRKQFNRDMQRVNSEILNLNTVLTKLAGENRQNEDKLQQRLIQLDSKIRDQAKSRERSGPRKE